MTHRSKKNNTVLVLDLDDTLYDEIEYVKSCFKEVSNYFSYKFKIDKSLI